MIWNQNPQIILVPSVLIDSCFIVHLLFLRALDLYRCLIYLGRTDPFMDLQTQAPSGVFEAVLERLSSIFHFVQII